jgi:hypothetical protein
MSQINVERVIGLLVTDEAQRRQFTATPRAFLLQMKENGMDLNPCELEALAALDPQALARFTRAIDSRLQKTDLRRGAS